MENRLSRKTFQICMKRWWKLLESWKTEFLETEIDFGFVISCLVSLKIHAMSRVSVFLAGYSDSQSGIS